MCRHGRKADGPFSFVDGARQRGPAGNCFCATFARLLNALPGASMHERGVWAQDTAFHSVRMVTHWNVSRAGIDRAIQELNAVVQKKKGQVA